jgi:N-acetyl-gamma-glutamyl-phosphate reductase
VVIRASGYTGADLVRLAHAHPTIEIVALAANSQAGKSTEAVFPHLACHLPARIGAGAKRFDILA